MIELSPEQEMKLGTVLSFGQRPAQVTWGEGGFSLRPMNTPDWAGEAAFFS